MLALRFEADFPIKRGIVGPWQRYVLWLSWVSFVEIMPKLLNGPGGNFWGGVGSSQEKNS